MKQIIFTKEQLKKLNEELGLNNQTQQAVVTISNTPTPEQLANAQKGLDNGMKVTMINQANKGTGVEAQNPVQNGETSPEILKRSQEMANQNDIYTVTSQKPNAVQESFKKSEIEKKRLNEMRRHGVIMTKNELNKLLNQ